MTKTTLAKNEEVKRKWYLIDATDKILGRMASRIAMVLMGKHKPIYTAHVDTGDNVIVINAEKIKLSGNKMQKKGYKTYSGYADGLKITPIATVMEKHPEQIVYLAVKRMIPGTRLGEQMFSKLKVYKGTTHPHQAQQPVPIEQCDWYKWFEIKDKSKITEAKR
jgi:large subunit ribosomal protein L13